MLRKLVATLAAIGAVRRKGVGALSQYGGTVQGQGVVKHKSGPKAGQETRFEIEGQPASRN